MKSNKYVWIDCEFTGLNHKEDKILEVACLITDQRLNILDSTGFHAVVHHPESVLSRMDSWNQTHHSMSGLTTKVRCSTKSPQDVEDQLASYLESFLGSSLGILCGNSVYVDRIYLEKDFPRVVKLLHFRQIDVSSFREFGLVHNNRLMMRAPRKKNKHEAMEDIRESIEELRWYANNYLIGYGGKY